MRGTRSVLAQVVYDYFPTALVVIEEMQLEPPKRRPWWAFWRAKYTYDTRPNVVVTNVQPDQHTPSWWLGANARGLWNAINNARAAGIHVALRFMRAEP